MGTGKRFERKGGGGWMSFWRQRSARIEERKSLKHVIEDVEKKLPKDIKKGKVNQVIKDGKKLIKDVHKFDEAFQAMLIEQLRNEQELLEQLQHFIMEITTIVEDADFPAGVADDLLDALDGELAQLENLDVEMSQEFADIEEDVKALRRNDRAARGRVRSKKK